MTGAGSAKSPGEKFAADSVPFVSDRTRAALANEYANAGDHKAVAFNINGFNGFVTGQPNEEAAKTAALAVSEAGRQRPVSAQMRVICRRQQRCLSARQAAGPATALDQSRFTDRKAVFCKGRPAGARGRQGPAREPVRVGAQNQVNRTRSGRRLSFNSGVDSIEGSARRNLESCGTIVGVPCLIVAVDDVFVVPIPATLHPLGFFKATESPVIALGERNDVVRKLNEASSGWNAIAVGTHGRPGLGLRAANEQAAVNEALCNCVKRDSDCHVIAIGPFAVGPN